MFKQITVLDIADVPKDIRTLVHTGYRDNITSNECYFMVYPYEVFKWDEVTDKYTDEIMTFEEFSEQYDCENMYNFLKWCIEQGQTEEFTLLYWW